jgi:Pyruvate/2-oxoacid:ferredoxin oxidoreductase delta subunit
MVQNFTNHVAANASSIQPMLTKMSYNLTGAIAANVSLAKTDYTPLAIVIAAIISALIAAYTWHLNENSKRSAREYRQKEDRYTKLIEGLNVRSQKEFKNDLNLCWLYCPDDVIRLATDYYVALENGTEEKIEATAGELIHAIRKDALKIETTLTPEYYRDKPNRLVQLNGKSITQTGMNGDMQTKKKG